MSNSDREPIDEDICPPHWWKIDTVETTDGNINVTAWQCTNCGRVRRSIS